MKWYKVGYHKPGFEVGEHQGQYYIRWKEQGTNINQQDVDYILKGFAENPTLLKMKTEGQAIGELDALDHDVKNRAVGYKTFASPIDTNSRHADVDTNLRQISKDNYANLNEIKVLR
jgi:hypothetical protein